MPWSSQPLPWRLVTPWCGRSSTGPVGILCPSRGEGRQDTEGIPSSASVQAAEVTVWDLCTIDFLTQIRLPNYQPTSNCREPFSPADTVLFRNCSADCIFEHHKYKAVYILRALLSFSSLNLHSCSGPVVFLYSSSVGYKIIIHLLTHWRFSHDLEVLRACFKLF